MFGISKITRGLVCGTVLSSASALSAAIIDIQSTGSVTSGLIRLADVADILDSDPQIQRRLENITLGPAPLPGRKVKITQQLIRERMLAHGVNLTEMEFTGQAMLVLENTLSTKPMPAAAQTPAVFPAVAARPVNANATSRRRAEGIVQAAFHRHYHTSEMDAGSLTLEVDIADLDVDFLLRSDPQALQFAEKGLRRGGPQPLTALVSDAKGNRREVRMQAWLNDTPQILTVKHTVPKGKVLEENDLVRAPAKPGQAGVEDAAHLIGKEVTRNLSPGAAVQPSDLTNVPLIRTNDLVTVKARSGGVSVSRTFKALASGADHDVIYLTALDNPREKIQARITGWHEAEIIDAPTDAAASPATRLR